MAALREEQARHGVPLQRRKWARPARMPALPWRGNSLDGVHAEDGVAAALDTGAEGDAAGGFNLRLFLHGPAGGVELDFEHVELLAFHFDRLIQHNNPASGLTANAGRAGEESADGERGGSSLPCGGTFVVAGGEEESECEKSERNGCPSAH